MNRGSNIFQYAGDPSGLTGCWTQHISGLGCGTQPSYILLKRGVHIVEERSDGFGPSRTVGYFLVEICKMFHKKKETCKM
jgi:hypothetical protein